MRLRQDGVYHFFCTLPDRLYPFRTRVRGQWVRGEVAYDAVVARHIRRFGAGHYGFGIDAYRQVFHLAGSLAFLSASAWLSHTLYGDERALYLFFTIAVVFFTYQEFYLHRRIYRQLWRKGIVDWLAWCAPMAVYMFVSVR